MLKSLGYRISSNLKEYVPTPALPKALSINNELEYYYCYCNVNVSGKKN